MTSCPPPLPAGSALASFNAAYHANMNLLSEVIKTSLSGPFRTTHTIPSFGDYNMGRSKNAPLGQLRSAEGLVKRILFHNCYVIVRRLCSATFVTKVAGPVCCWLAALTSLFVYMATKHQSMNGQQSRPFIGWSLVTIDTVRLVSATSARQTTLRSLLGPYVCLILMRVFLPCHFLTPLLLPISEIPKMSQSWNPERLEMALNAVRNGFSIRATVKKYG